MAGVAEVTATDEGLAFEASERDAVAAVIAGLVAREVPVFGATTHEPTLEDVYFAVEARAQDDGARPSTDAGSEGRST